MNSENLRYVGKMHKNMDVIISPSSPNNHVIMSGISGSGKSYRIEDMERRIVDRGGTVVVIDINGNHSLSIGNDVSFISAQEDGLMLHLLDRKWVDEGKETISNLISYVIWAICPKQLRGACQISSVREAVKFALNHRSAFASDMDAIAYGLKKQNTQAAQGAYNHLYDVLEGKVFCNCRKKIRKHDLNIISLKGINPVTQKKIAEILLCAFWRQMRMYGEKNDAWTLVIDEFQNLNFAEGSALYQMLTEARKYHLSLLLATQTMSIFSKKERAILNQAAVQLFFRQAKTDERQIAALIDATKKEKWEMALKHLHVGEAIAVGDLQVNGRDIMQPVITTSEQLVHCSKLATSNSRERR